MNYKNDQIEDKLLKHVEQEAVYDIQNQMQTHRNVEIRSKRISRKNLEQKIETQLKSRLRLVDEVKLKKAMDQAAQMVESQVQEYSPDVKD